MKPSNRPWLDGPADFEVKIPQSDGPTDEARELLILASLDVYLYKLAEAIRLLYSEEGKRTDTAYYKLFGTPDRAVETIVEARDLVKDYLEGIILEKKGD